MLINQKNIKLVAWTMFIGVALLAMIVHKDYGISWDEGTHKDTTLLVEKYVLKGDKELFSTLAQYYGPAFEFILLFAERIFKPNGTIQNVYFMRHLINFYFFLIGVFFFYLLMRAKFKNETMGLLSICFLILSPRIFADAFYNSKDIPFLSAFTVSIYTLTIFLKKRSLWASVVHAVTCAVLIDMRVLGIMVPALTLIFLIFDFIFDESTRKEWIKTLISWILYGVCLVIFTILFWPYLWEHPVTKFMEVYKLMSQYNWGGTVLYFGDYIKADRLPWHYIPVWMSITTPVLYSIFFVLGFVKLIYSFILNPLSFYKNYKLDLICLFWLSIPITAVIVKHSVLYDGWRQMYFVYPAFLIVALDGISFLLNWVGNNFKSWKKTFAFLMIISTITVNSAYLVIKMIRLHPFQNLYFNFLAGRNLQEIKNKFELDYWGLSFRKALEFIADHDERKTIKVHPSNLAGDFNLHILDPADQKRIVFLRSIDGADYFMTNYRWHPTDYDYQEELFFVERDGAKIVSVFKLK